MNDENGSARVFIAIELSDEVRARLAAMQQPLIPHGSALRLVDPARLHLTVRFLGQVAIARFPSVELAVREAVTETAQFTLRIGQFGVFPVGRGRPRVMWAGVANDQGRTSLMGLFDALEDALETQGFEREPRQLSPHITLARVRDGVPSDVLRRLEPVLKRLQDRDGPHASVEVTRLTMMQSDLLPGGPRYTPLMVAELSGLPREDTI